MIKETEAVSVLLYVRPWNQTQMEYLARGVWGECITVTKTSEHCSIDQSGLCEAQSQYYRQLNDQEKLLDLSDDEAEDMILRCRLLRNLSPMQARRLLISMERAVSDVLVEVKPTVMLSLTVDSYVMDIYAALCHKRGIRFIGLVPSFIKEHFRITARGEYVECRNVTEEEIKATLSDLEIKNYRPDFLVQSDREMRRNKWRMWWRNFFKPLFFALRRIKPRDRLNYHYWASQIIATKHFSLMPRDLKGIGIQEVTVKADDGGLPLIYLPLQMSPEATIDYWSTDKRWIDYENFIIDLVSRYRQKWRFIIKEHPNLIGFRSRDFYERLKAESNCLIVAPNVASNDLVGLCRGVVVCTGTVGFEAVLRGKPVLSDSSPYYSLSGNLLPLSALDHELPDKIQEENKQMVLMEHVLKGALPGRFLNNGTWDIDNPAHRAWAHDMAASIKNYLNFSEAL